MASLVRVRRALISVSNKTGIIELARQLQSHNIEILSTGGTKDLLEKEGISVKAVSEFTHFPEILEGRVKTLHPKIHGGLLGKRDDATHRSEMEKNQIEPIDLVVVNLYPFEQTLAKGNTPLAEAIENIDIGGPSMIRSAAKNFESVAVIVDPQDYHRISELLKKHNGELDRSTRFYLAQKAFSHTAAYDGAISNYLTAIPECPPHEVPVVEPFPASYTFQVQRASTLRYGENPHQKAAFYQFNTVAEPCVSNAICLHGKELSFNNLIDLNAALELVKEFQYPACTIIKHTNPCGTATGESLREAFLNAKSCDPISAFGGIVAVNRMVDEAFVREFNSVFFEALIAPDYQKDALELLKTKKNLRILKTPSILETKPEKFDLKKIVGGLLIQERDLASLDLKKCKVVSKRFPTNEEWKALEFAWKVCKHVKSNAIVYADAHKTLGIGAGQMSRVDSVKFGALKAQNPLKGCALASDAFFPFRDGVDAAAQFGVKSMIQPGGSIRDEEVVAAADEHEMAMVFTDIRHFRHG